MQLELQLMSNDPTESLDTPAAEDSLLTLLPQIDVAVSKLPSKQPHADRSEGHWGAATDVVRRMHRRSISEGVRMPAHSSGRARVRVAAMVAKQEEEGALSRGAGTALRARVSSSSNRAMELSQQ